MSSRRIFTKDQQQCQLNSKKHITALKIQLDSIFLLRKKNALTSGLRLYPVV